MIDLPCAEEDWPRFSELLEVALDLPETEQLVWLGTLPAEDARLKSGLALVLGQAAAHNTASLLSMPRLQSGFSSGSEIGPYVLISKLGEGGMGEVWRARRHDDGPRREVALKLPHPDCLTAHFQRRFIQERDVLAALSHPNIAQLYEAGSSADGIPYLALELVTGAPITPWCQEHKLSLARRIQLVAEILDGLSYAHQRLIVHRDIKPSNVMVTPDGHVKLLDFGIAKLLDSEGAEDPKLTRTVRMATPRYAAPEQLSGGAITVPTDLFAVGTLLFELCTGHLPFPDRQIGVHSLAPPASSRADPERAGIPDGKRLPRLLRGDLDAVIAKALAVAPTDRYSTAEAFRADLDRWSKARPVRARRTGWLTRATKFCRRNPFAVSVTAVLGLAIILGAAGIAWQARRAEAEAARATAIKDFMVGLFAAEGPRGGKQPLAKMTALDLLDAGAEKAGTAFGNDLETRFDLLLSFEQIFSDLDDFERARGVLSKRFATAEQLYGADDPRSIATGLNSATLEIEALNYDNGKKILEGLRGPILRSRGPDSTLYALWLTRHAQSLRATRGAHADAVESLKRAIAIFSRNTLSDEEAETSISARLLLAMRQYNADQYEDSLATLRELRAIELAKEPGDVMHAMSYLHAFALDLERLGKLQAADALFLAEQTSAAQTLGTDHYTYANAIAKRVLLAARHGDIGSAHALLAKAGAGLTSGPDLLRTAAAFVLVQEGNGSQATGFLKDALDRAGRTARDEVAVWTLQGALGEAYDQDGRFTEAGALLQAASENWRRFGSPGQRSALAAQERWARFLLEQGKLAEAKAQALAVTRVADGAALAPAALAEADLAAIALAEADQPEADRQSALALKTLDQETREYDARARVIVLLTRANVMLAAGNPQTAQSFAEIAATLADKYDAPGTAQPIAARAFLERIAKMPRSGTGTRREQ